jgi:hypothetical protein
LAEVAADDERIGETIADHTAGTTAPRAPSTAAFGERFAVGEELGRGGMGRVVEATDRSLARTVAIKQALTLDPGDRARFEREIHITAQLEHPSIVPVHETGIDADGQPYYVMRKIAGEPLSARITRTATARARLALVPNVLAVVDAAAFAHARNIIHRDIKPANILLGEYGETLLIDWGVARFLDEADGQAPASLSGNASDAELTQVGAAIGTPGYMAPEQARAERVDARADVYALGATLYEVVSGRPPFHGTSAGDRMAMAILGESPPMNKIDPDVPAELLAIVAKAMAGDLDERYRDAGALAADLRAFLAGKLVAAHHYTARERLVRFVRKHRVAVAIGAIATVGLLVFGTIAIVSVVRARDQAEVEAENAARQTAIALDRAELNSVERARELATREPARAVALLRQLPATSPYRRRARDIAATAASSGIAHGSAVHKGPVEALDLSPDGKQLVSAAAHTIAVHDVATARTTTFDLAHPVVSTLWVDGGIAFSTGPTVELLDPRTGKSRTLGPGNVTTAMWRAPGATDRMRFVDTLAHALIELTVTGDRRVLATDVLRATHDGDVTMLVGATTARVLVGDHEVALAMRMDPTTIAVDRQRNRMAAATMKMIVEIDLATGEELEHHELFGTYMLGYLGDMLYAATAQGRLLEIKGTVLDIARTGTGIGFGGRTAAGFAIIHFDGSLTAVTRAEHYQLPLSHASARLLASNEHSTIIATGSLDGTVRWWDFALLAPAPIPSERASICLVTDDAVYFARIDGLARYDRATGTLTPLADAMMPFCTGTTADGTLLFESQGQALLVDRSGHVRRLPADPDHVAIVQGGKLYYVVGRVLHELAGTTDTVRWTAPADVISVAANGEVVALALADRHLVRLRAGAWEPVTVEASTVLYGIAPDGVLWFTTTANEVWQLADRPVRTRLTGPPKIVFGVDGGVGLVLEDGSAWFADRAGRMYSRLGPTRWSGISYAFPDRVVVAGMGFMEVTVIAMGSGERVVHSFAEGHEMISLSPTGHSLATTTMSNYIVVFDDPVPDDPAKLDAWIDTATNARIDPDTDALIWQ